MADDSQEKTEEATAKRQEKSREEGEVPRSRELNNMAVLICGAIALYFFNENFVNGMTAIFKSGFSFNSQMVMDTGYMAQNFLKSAKEALKMLFPFLLLTFFIGLFAPILIGGWNFSVKALMPKFSRMNPLAGIKRMFSLKSIIELVKAIGKVSLVGSVCYFIFDYNYRDFISLGLLDIKAAITYGFTHIVIAFILMASSLIIIVAIDVPFQFFDHKKKLKMSKKELMDEMKETEGKPEVKGKIRRLQQEIANRQMLQNVPDADVIITNPTHFSVAISYREGEHGAPILVAKGADLVALKIREIANEHNVPIVEAPPLARSVFFTTEVEQEVPEGLYIAVAQILAYVYQLRQFKRFQMPKPTLPKDFDIPQDLQH